MRFSLAVVIIATNASASSLPRCTVAVAGANGRVGSMVCRELLRNHPQVSVRALVRSASDPYKGYGRLSYEVGAEDGKMDLRPAWQMDAETGVMGAASMEFDPSVQSGYGLDRLELRECELRYKPDLEEALTGVDAVIWCATAFNAFRQRLPDRLDEAARGVDQRGMALFELRFGKALFGEGGKGDGSDERRREASRGKTADVEGVELAAQIFGSNRRRKATLAELTGGQGRSGAALSPIVMCSAAACLGYDEDRWSKELSENEFGFRKRSAEALLGASDVPHIVVRSAALDDVRGEEGLGIKILEDPDAAARQKMAETVAAGAEAGSATGSPEAEGAVGVRDDEAKKRRIHPRDLAKFLVACLEPAPASGRVVEAWTYEE